MKKIIILLIFLLSGILANGQMDTKPTPTDPVTFLQVPRYLFWYNKADTSLWANLLNNPQIPEWIKLLGANRQWWTQIEKIIAGDTTFNRVHNRDSVNMTIYKLKDDSLKFYKLKTDSVTLKGYFTNSKARQYRKLNNHDSLSKLDERKYQSLTDTLTWGLGLSQTWHTVKVDTASASILSRQRALKEYEVKSNKVTSISGASTDIQYGSAKLLYDQLALKAPVSIYPATGLTTGYVPYKSATVLANSNIFYNGTNVGIGTTDPGTYRVKINGTTYSDGVITTGTTGTSTDWNEAHSWGNPLGVYLPLTGGNLSGALQILPANSDAVWSGSGLFMEAGTRIGLRAGTDYSFNIDMFNGGNKINALKIAQNGTATFSSTATANAFIKIGGTSAQYLLADGSVTTSSGAVYKDEVDGDDGLPRKGGSALIDGTGTTGWYYACYDAGTYDYGNPNGNPIVLAIGDQIYYNGTIWIKIPGAGSYTLPIATASLGGVVTNTNVSVNASTGGMAVLINADLTGPITSVGNATAIASQTGTGSTFVMSVAPTLAGETILNGTFKLTNSGYFKGSPTYGYRFNDNTNTYNNYIIYENGDTYTRGIITTETTGTSTDWNEAHSWGNPLGVYLPLTGGNLSGALQILPANSDAVWSGSGLFMEAGTRIGLRAGTDYSFNIDMFNGGNKINALKIAQNGTITTGSTLYTNGVISTDATGTSTDWNKYNQWDGGATGLVAATGRTSLGLGTAATTAATDYATAAQANATHTGDVTGATALTLATVTVPKGGTGLTTLTDEAVMIGNGTATPTFVAPSTAGNVLTSYNGAWASRTPTGGGMVYPSGTGVAVVTSGTSWGTTLGYASANTASALVQRDASGDFAAHIITATNFQLSDIRLKKNINSIDFKNIKTDKVQWIQYVKKDDKTNTLHYGVSAQKLEKIFPQFVNTATDNLKTKSVNYTELLVLKMATMEIKQAEMQQEIKILQNKVSNLERKYNRRKNEN